MTPTIEPIQKGSDFLYRKVHEIEYDILGYVIPGATILIFVDIRFFEPSLFSFERWSLAVRSLLILIFGGFIVGQILSSISRFLLKRIGYHRIGASYQDALEHLSYQCLGPPAFGKKDDIEMIMKDSDLWLRYIAPEFRAFLVKRHAIELMCRNLSISFFIVSIIWLFPCESISPKVCLSVSGFAFLFALSFIYKYRNNRKSRLRKTATAIAILTKNWAPTIKPYDIEAC